MRFFVANIVTLFILCVSAIPSTAVVSPAFFQGVRLKTANFNVNSTSVTDLCVLDGQATPNVSKFIFASPLFEIEGSYTQKIEQSGNSTLSGTSVIIGKNIDKGKALIYRSYLEDSLLDIRILPINLHGGFYGVPSCGVHIYSIGVNVKAFNDKDNVIQLVDIQSKRTSHNLGFEFGRRTNIGNFFLRGRWDITNDRGNTYEIGAVGKLINTDKLSVYGEVSYEVSKMRFTENNTDFGITQKGPFLGVVVGF